MRKKSPRRRLATSRKPRTRSKRITRKDGFIVKKVRRKRNYKAEYARRIARWLAKGFSRAQARGHPKPSELPVSSRNQTPPPTDARLQDALRVLRQENNLKAAARAAQLSPEQFKRTARAKHAITRKGRGWGVNPKLPRRVLIYSRGTPIQVTVGDFDSASLVGRYMAAIGKFLGSNNIDALAPFVGQSVTDISGKAHPLETNPNALHRIASAGGESFEAVYRIVV